MQAFTRGYRGLSVIMVVNSDRIFTVGTMVAGSLAGAFVGSSLMGH